MHKDKEFTLARDVEAILIPSGAKTTIPQGTPGVITQALGGSYTVATYQGLARVSEKDADALGLEKTAASNGAEKSVASSNGDVDDRTGHTVLQVLYEQFQREGIRAFFDCFVTSLITCTETSLGATAINLRSGTLELLTARAIILATGGFTRLYAPSTASIPTGVASALIPLSEDSVPLGSHAPVPIHGLCTFWALLCRALLTVNSPSEFPVRSPS